MQLRTYQSDIVLKVRSSAKKGNRRICAVLGCG